MSSVKAMQRLRLPENITSLLRNSVSYTKLYLWKRDYADDALTTGNILQTHPLRREDLDDRFKAYREKQLLQNRLDAGYKGYWSEYDDSFVHVHWYAEATYDVWDIRSTLIIPNGDRYLFDVYTVPKYRGERFFSAALASSCSDIFASDCGTLHVLTQAQNAPANAAFANIGFERYAAITFWQVPSFRYHAIQTGVHIQRHVRLMRLRNPLYIIDLANILPCRPELKLSGRHARPDRENPDPI